MKTNGWRLTGAKQTIKFKGKKKAQGKIYKLEKNPNPTTWKKERNYKRKLEIGIRFKEWTERKEYLQQKLSKFCLAKNTQASNFRYTPIQLLRNQRRAIHVLSSRICMEEVCFWNSSRFVLLLFFTLQDQRWCWKIPAPAVSQFPAGKRSATVNNNFTKG